MLGAKEFSALIGGIYDSVLKPDLWRSVLEQICRHLDAKAASVHVVNPIEGRASLFIEHGTDPAWTALLLSKYAGMSPIGSAVLVADLDQPVGAFDFVDEQEFVESRFYKEWCAPQGYHDMMGAIIAKKPRSIGAVSATRLSSKGKFGVAEREFVGLIAPHVRRAVTLSGLLEQQAAERSTLAGVIDQLSTAVVLHDRSGRITRANPTAQALLGQELLVAQKNGAIVVLDDAAAAALKSALSGAIREPQFIAATGQDGERYILVLMPIDSTADAFALFLNKPEPDLPAVGKALVAAFGLTPREVSVLLALAAGKTIDAVAEGLGIGAATARSHLNNLFAKTGTNRQVELVQKAMSLMPPVHTGS